MKSFRRSLLAVMVTALFVMVGCNNHIHTFSEKWSKNETSHWHESTCEHVLKDSEGSHTWNHEDYQYDSATGKDIRVCTTCAYVDKKDHNHTWNHEDCQYDSATGKDILTCTVCEYVDKKDHTHIWDNEEYKYDLESGKDMRSCTVCAYVDKKSHTHVWDNEKYKIDLKTGKDVRTCTACSYVEEKDRKHIWDNEEYKYDSATGKDKRTCTECSYVDIKEHEHIWNYKYDSESGKDNMTCKACAAVDKRDHVHAWDHKDNLYDSESGKDIRTCKACAFVELKEHTHNEDTGTVTTESTYFTKGVKTFKCTDCSDDVRTEDIPELYSYPVDTETGLPATVASKTVYFGVFPNTIKDESVTVDTNDTITVGKNCYYKGSDGEWYEKVTADPYPAYARKYSNNTVVVKGSIDYFKVEPIKWNVLKTDYDIDGEEGSATGCLLHSAQCLDVGYYYTSNLDRIIGEKTIASNNYQYSTVRAYLNGKYESNDTSSTYKNKGFLQTAFTKSAQALILDTLVDNSLASTTDGGDFFVEEKTIQYVCDNTIDKIFLLSVKEVTSMEYGFAAYNKADKNRKVSFTDYVYAKFVADEWILRSPSESKTSIVKVDGIGRANYKHISYSRYSGIVPALTISLPLE